MAGLFIKKQQPLLFLLHIILQEKDTFNKTGTFRLEACKLIAHITRKQSRTPKIYENVERADSETIDKQEMALQEAEISRWKAVLTRLLAIVHSLAVRNLALRGHTEKLFSPSNCNFLKEVELMAQFDPIMQEHINRVQQGTSSYTSYFGHHIQNQLIDLLSSKTISAMVADIKQSKFFSIILDCTPDISHTE